MRGFVAGMCLGMFGLAAGWSQQGVDNGQKCRDLAKAALPHTAVLRAEVTEAGKLASPLDDKDPIYGQLPAFCRVVAEAHPSADSQIKIEVWLPLTGWNGKFLGQGNGGFAGNIYYRELAKAVHLGYATAGTDTGHTGSAIDAGWALGHPEKVADFGFRGVHEMSLTGQALTRAFYGSAAGRRYFASCSDGGREALMEAQRFPADYDGILAGAPAYHWTWLVTGGLPAVQALGREPASAISAAKLPAISAAVLAQCNAGKTTAFLDDPRTCHFDVNSLLCKGAETNECLTAAQAATLKLLYAGARTSDGRVINPGQMPGAELGGNGWEAWITGNEKEKSLGLAFLYGYLANMIYGKTDVDVQKLKLDAVLKAAEEKTGGLLDAVNPDLSAFSARGGKLILYHGWNDPAIPALGTVDYFNSVVAKAGAKKASEFTRLFMVPGLQHCGGGPGATAFGQDGPSDNPAASDPDHNIYAALENWVEKGVAPETVIAVHPSDGAAANLSFSRPICAYPKAARYTGSGDPDKASSYACSAAQ